MRENVVRDFAELVEACEEYRQLYIQVEESLMSCDLLAIMAVDKHFKRCQETFERLEYLRNLGERDILVQYLPVIS
jgi:hypothetical protein